MHGTISFSGSDCSINSADPGIASTSEVIASSERASEPDLSELRLRPKFSRMSAAEFEAELQEFCRLARLGFTILNQSGTQLADVGYLLRSLGDGSAADDFLMLVLGGCAKAEAFLELTQTAELRCEAAFQAGPIA
jgi:hypothetical protein